jgi:hypothetical protein
MKEKYNNEEEVKAPFLCLGAEKIIRQKNTEQKNVTKDVRPEAVRDLALRSIQ